MSRKMIRVPGSTTNLGAGFDTLGLALKLYLQVDLEEAEASESEILFAGEGSKEIPLGRENLIGTVMRRVFAGENGCLPSVRLQVLNEIDCARFG
ncbi:MAG: hypothetical protein WKF84_04315 [Pyrinomonadaceae bacterium]